MEGEARDVIFVPNEEKIEADEEPKIDDPDCIEHSSKTPTAAPSTVPTAVHLTVGVPIWKYLAKSKTFSDALNSIVSQHEIVCELDSDAVVLKGQTENRLILAKRQIEELIEECQVDARTFIIPHLEPDVHSKVMSFLEGQDEITLNLYSKTNQICLTGQKKQIDDCLGVLQEIYGVTGALPFLNGETSGISGSVSVVNHHIGQDPDCTENLVNKVAETDDDVCIHDQFDDKLYGTDASSFEIEDDALIMNEKIWLYIEKRYCEDIKQIKEKLGLEGAMETSALTEQCDHRVRITFSGPDEALICKSMLEMKSVIERCQGANIKTLEVPCLDVAVHQRITKLLKPINRLPSYVSMGPELISITGTKEEIDVCLEKLKTYGLQYEDHAAPVESSPQPVNEIPVVDKATKDFDSDDDGMPQQYEHYRQLPTPVEESVWFYIENRCRQQLNDLKKGYNLQIIPDQAGAPGLVNITLASHSTDMLDCGQDALIALIMQLRQQIVLGVMSTASLEDLPFELQGMLQQQFHNMDSLVVVKGNKIITIGPNHEAMKSQQIVSAFMQNIVADARRMGYDTSKFDPAMMPTGGFRSDDLRTSGDFIGFNPQENCMDAIDQKDQHSSTSTRSAEALNGDHMGSDQRVQVSGSGHLKTCEEKPLLESKSDKTVSVPDISSGSAGTQKDSNENSKKSFESNQPCVVSDNLSAHMEDSRPNGGNKVFNGTQCNAAKANVHVCSSCYRDLSSSSSRDGQSCGHVYCVSCICQHFGEWKCPVCDIENSTKNQIVSQPENGTMLVTYDNSFKLPGFENSSRGTMIITYAFPSGIQSVRFSLHFSNEYA